MYGPFVGISRIPLPAGREFAMIPFVELVALIGIVLPGVLFPSNELPTTWSYQECHYMLLAWELFNAYVSSTHGMLWSKDPMNVSFVDMFLELLLQERDAVCFVGVLSLKHLTYIEKFIMPEDETGRKLRRYTLSSMATTY